MELQQYLRIIQRYWRSTLATILAAVVLAGLVTLVQRPVYTASSSLYMAVESGDTAGELSQGATYAERQVQSYVTVATTATVLQPVIDELGLETTPQQLAKKLTVTSPASTSIIRVSAEDTDAALATQLSDAVSSQLVDAVEELSPPRADGSRLVMATVIDPAIEPTVPTSPRPAMNLALGGLLGILLGIGQAILRSILDTRIRTREDVEEVTNLPVLGEIGHVDSTADRASANEGRQWANAEAYRRLRTNVGFLGLGGERRSSIVITSSVGAEGKTETAVALARVLAEAGDSVLLIDADLRRPQVASRMRLDSQLGLTDVLSGRGSVEDLIIEVIPGQLTVLPAGTVPPNPSELLGSEAMAHLIATVERRYDYVLFDAPPLLPVTDATVLASQTGGAVIVARSGVAKKPQLEQALGLLEAGHGTGLGVVLNDVFVSKTDLYGGYYSSFNQQEAATA